jgi:hypothetical protein
MAQTKEYSHGRSDEFIGFAYTFSPLEYVGIVSKPTKALHTKLKLSTLPSDL